LQARTGVMQVFSRHIERALNFNRKDRHRRRRKLKND
jgi:hypothetical protein